jgi:cobalamin biosynthesis Mg chelatase CobN
MNYSRGGGVTATGGVARETRRKPEKKTGEGLPYLKILIVFIVLILFGLVWLVLTGY